MKTLTVAEMEDMAEMGCGDPTCTHDHDGKVWLNQRCHPGAGHEVLYEKGTYKIVLTCRACKEAVAEIAVGLAPLEV